MMASESVGPSPTWNRDEARPTDRRQPPRTWRAKLADAFRGVKLGIRGQSSFFVHFFCTAAALGAGLVMGLDWLSWCALLLCIGIVLTAEMFNSALETLCRGLDEQTRNRCAAALDVAAGAVLFAACTAVLVGGLIFLNRLAGLLYWR